MIRRVLFSLLYLASASPAIASQVTVVAGEHPGFTRLILEFDVLPDWTLVRSARGYRMYFGPGRIDAYDLSRVFRLIGRERISDVRVAGDGLEIDLACDCGLTVVPASPAALVIDVAPAATAAEALDDTSTVFEPNLRRYSIPPGWIAGVPYLSDGASETKETTRSVAVDLVSREFARAAAQGLVSPTEIQPPRRGNLTTRSIVSGEHSNLAVSNSIDLALYPDGRLPPPTETGMVCRPDGDVDVGSWGDAEDGLALGRARRDAVAEDGTITAEGALAMSRFYLAMGFGAEAASTARLVRDPGERRLLFALADIMDYGRSESRLFAGQIYCEGAVALWSALARPFGPAERPATSDHILTAFSDLPPHLRAHLGPILSERLDAAGMEEAARTALNAVTRGGTHTKKSELAAARLDLDGTRSEQARARLIELSGGTDMTAAEALLELLLDAEARGMPPNPDWVADAPTLVGALEGAEISASLNLAGLRGLIALDAFDTFRERLTENGPGLTSDSRRALAVLAIRAVVERGEDRGFLETELALARLVAPGDLDRTTRFAVAARYAALGLAPRGLFYLPEDPATTQELATTTEVLVAAGRTTDAAGMLAASADPAAVSLLGRVLAMSDRDVDAIAVLFSAGLTEEASAAAIRNGDWSWLSENGIAPVAAASRELAGDTTIAATDAPNGAKIDRSRVLRDHARTLLEVVEPPDTGPPFTN